MSPPAIAPIEDKPAPVTTMTVQGRDLFSAAGERVLLRGINKMFIFNDRTGNSLPEIRLSGANSVRIVWQMHWGNPDPTAAELDDLIQRAITERLIPMVELHDATGNLAMLPDLVAWWTSPDILAVIAKHERWLLLNVANEAGDDTVDAPTFRAAYIAAVGSLRAAGIRVPLVIDAPEWGKNLDVVLATADDILKSDPLSNLLFSVHMYWPKNGGADATFINGKIAAAAQAGIPLIVGEFAGYGAWAGAGKSPCSADGAIDYGAIIAACDQHQVGWYAWEWGPGNDGGGDPLCTVMDMTDGTFATLKPGWASDVVTAIQATSIIPGSL